MIYKKEFLNIFESKENKDNVELLSFLVDPFEKEFKKDLFQFTAEEIEKFYYSIMSNKKDIFYLIITYTRFVQQMN